MWLRASLLLSLLAASVVWMTPVEAALLVPQRMPAVENDADQDGLSASSERLFGTDPANADTDADGIADGDEILYFQTNPRLADTDKDGFTDGQEIVDGFSPTVPKKQLSEVDSDEDGLPDAVEITFGTQPFAIDTDQDGFADGAEVASGFDPRTAELKKLEKSIAIHLKTQKFSYYLDGKKVAEYSASTGKRSTPTPTGTFTIAAKAPRTWSNHAGLWMPWWLNFRGPKAQGGLYAIHELPEWPGGKKEGAAHLGTPVSGGCVRLGIGPAKLVYDWTPVGTTVKISAD